MVSFADKCEMANRHTFLDNYLAAFAKWGRIYPRRCTTGSRPSQVGLTNEDSNFWPRAGKLFLLRGWKVSLGMAKVVVSWSQYGAATISLMFTSIRDWNKKQAVCLLCYLKLWKAESKHPFIYMWQSRWPEEQSSHELLWLQPHFHVKLRSRGRWTTRKKTWWFPYITCLLLCGNTSGHIQRNKPLYA
jgi:hypothetical protein